MFYKIFMRLFSFVYIEFYMNGYSIVIKEIYLRVPVVVKYTFRPPVLGFPLISVSIIAQKW